MRFAGFSFCNERRVINSKSELEVFQGIVCWVSDFGMYLLRKQLVVFHFKKKVYFNHRNIHLSKWYTRTFRRILVSIEFHLYSLALRKEISLKHKIHHTSKKKKSQTPHPSRKKANSINRKEQSIPKAQGSARHEAVNREAQRSARKPLSFSIQSQLASYRPQKARSSYWYRAAQRLYPRRRDASS